MYNKIVKALTQTSKWNPTRRGSPRLDSKRRSRFRVYRTLMSTSRKIKPLPKNVWIELPKRWSVKRSRRWRKMWKSLAQSPRMYPQSHQLRLRRQKKNLQIRSWNIQMRLNSIKKEVHQCSRWPSRIKSPLEWQTNSISSSTNPNIKACRWGVTRLAITFIWIH